MNKEEIANLIDVIARSRDIPKEAVVESVKTAILISAKKAFGKDKEIEVSFNEDYTDFEVFEFKQVVDKIENPSTDIEIQEARELDPESQVGDEIGLKIPNDRLTRISANVAKQIVFQRVQNEEKNRIYNNYIGRKDQLVSGTVVRILNDNIHVDLGNANAIILKRDLSPRDKFKAGDTIKASIKDIKINSYPQIYLTRTENEFLFNLFKEEIPEVRDGDVQIKSIAREAGARTKVALYSSDSKIDPVGTCVGMGGLRIHSIKRELRGERIDLIEWSPDEGKFIYNALCPAEASRIIMDSSNQVIETIIPDDQVSLVIGRSGVNIKLISRLIGWKLTVISKSEYEEEKGKAFEELKKIGVYNEVHLQSLFNSGMKTVNDVAKVDLDFLKNIPGLSEELAVELKNNSVNCS